MSHYDSHPPGNFVWPEHATTNAESAKQFYSAIFGWSCTDNPMGPDMVYTIANLEDRNAAGLYSMPQMMLDKGVPPHWLTYVGVESADATAAKTKELGGEAIWGPEDIPHVGRMVVLKDPQGAVFAAFQPGGHKGVGILGVHGTMTWVELMTTDTDAAKAFYSGVFGWTTQTMPMPQGEYTMFVNGAKPVGGCMKLGDDMPGVPPNWVLYFDVDNCDATVAVAKENGGQELMPAMDVPGAGRMCAMIDPQGAAFAVIQLANR